MSQFIDADIYQDVPDKDFPHLVMGLGVGDRFEIHIQVQHGFIRAAIFTSCTARWMSPILVNDEENRLMLIEDIFESVLQQIRPGDGKPKLRLIREENKK